MQEPSGHRPTGIQGQIKRRRKPQCTRSSYHPCRTQGRPASHSVLFRNTTRCNQRCIQQATQLYWLDEAPKISTTRTATGETRITQVPSLDPVSTLRPSGFRYCERAIHELFDQIADLLLSWQHACHTFLSCLESLLCVEFSVMAMSFCPSASLLEIVKEL